MIIGNNLHVEAFFDEATYTVTYLVTDPETRRAATPAHWRCWRRLGILVS